MASHKSALKAHRQEVHRRVRNRARRTRLRSQLKNLRAAVRSGNVEVAQGMLRATLSIVDRSVKHGVLHRNAGARTKSRLSRSVARLASAGRD